MNDRIYVISKNYGNENVNNPKLPLTHNNKGECATTTIKINNGHRKQRYIQN